MKITLENGNQIPLDHMICQLEPGVNLAVEALLDKEGNTTELLIDTAHIIGRHPDGYRVEIDIADNSWEAHTEH